MPEPLGRPSYGYHSLAAVLPAALGALGVSAATGTGLGTQQAVAELGLPRTKRVVVVLCDGLGWHNLNERIGHSPFLRAQLPAAQALTTCFPSTTVAALGTFGTGTAPGRTAMVGYTQRDPRTGKLANLIQWCYPEPSEPPSGGSATATSGAEMLPSVGPKTRGGRRGSRRHRANQAPPPPRLDWTPTELQREPTVFEQADGVAVATAGPAKFAGSALTLAALRGGEYLIAESLAERVDALVAWAQQSPSLGYLYWGELDKIGHHDGWQSASWADALGEFDREMGRLAQSLPTGSLVLITADHGQIDVDPIGALDVAQHSELNRDWAVAGGEPRALHLYLEPGVDPDEVAARWRGYLADRLVAEPLILTQAAAVSEGLFGPAATVSPHVLPWIGDVVVALGGRDIIVDSRTQSDAARSLIGVHGSLTSTELEIPLFRIVCSA